MKKPIYLKDIGDEGLRNLTECVLKTYDTLRKDTADMEWRIEHADRTIDILFSILEEKKIFDRTRKPYLSWVDVLISAVYLYFFVKNRQRPERFIELFEIRQDFEESATKNGVNPQTFDILCQAVEAAGGNSGVPNCKPVPGTPTELMSLAIFMEQNILPKYDGTETH